MSFDDASQAVEVAVALVQRGGKILAVYNEHWVSFTLPMSKVHRWEPGSREERAVKGVEVDPWEEAAGRAVAEWLGKPVPKPAALFEMELTQTERGGAWSRYHFKVFTVNVREETEFAPGLKVAWLAADDFLSYTPISPTAHAIIANYRKSS